jgi:hypothetical protein
MNANDIRSRLGNISRNVANVVADSPDGSVTETLGLAIENLTQILGDLTDEIERIGTAK